MTPPSRPSSPSPLASAIVAATICTFAALAFLALGSIAARGAEPGPASVPFSARTLRLNEISVHRYVPSTNGTILERRYLLDARNGLTHVTDTTVPVSVTIPAEAFDKILIASSAWLAYRQLSPVAFDNFELTTEIPILIADRGHFEVRVSPEARLDAGRLVNISTRGTASTTAKLIAGFVITEQHRRVLVRAVGPGLAPFGVPGPMADPFVTLYKGNLPQFFNDDWSTRPDVDGIKAAATAVGAFPLTTGSKDAAFVVELEPGAYTVQVEPATGTGGAALVEVYSVP